MCWSSRASASLQVVPLVTPFLWCRWPASFERQLTKATLSLPSLAQARVHRSLGEAWTRPTP